MSRLPPVTETASPAVAEVFGEIKATRGFVSNALRSIGHAPEGLKHLARLGAYTKYQTDLPERLRELSILCAARGVAYAWTHHSALAVQAGIPQAAVDDMSRRLRVSSRKRFHRNPPAAKHSPNSRATSRRGRSPISRCQRPTTGR
ncbi:MAG: hypothetical protein K8S22_02130 [Betaproteobacteria bacterium]|nr:hypothetical protein [Betaproteobacteria bacterium]